MECINPLFSTWDFLQQLLGNNGNFKMQLPVVKRRMSNPEVQGQILVAKHLGTKFPKRIQSLLRRTKLLWCRTGGSKESKVISSMGQELKKTGRFVLGLSILVSQLSSCFLLMHAFPLHQKFRKNQIS